MHLVGRAPSPSALWLTQAARSPLRWRELVDRLVLALAIANLDEPVCEPAYADAMAALLARLRD